MLGLNIFFLGNYTHTKFGGYREISRSGYNSMYIQVFYNISKGLNFIDIEQNLLFKAK